ncbi:unnamed protein product, partial [Medioppia subpectinata]
MVTAMLTIDELQTKLSNCIKEFPTKSENHLKRKGRRELAHSSSFKMKARSSSPIRDESMLYERGEHSLSPNFSPGPHTASTPPQHLLMGGREPLPMAAGDQTSNAHSSYTTYAGVGGAAQRTSLVAVDRPDGLLSAYRGSPYHHIDGAKHSSSSLIIRRNSDAMSQNSTTQSSSAGSPPIGGHSADDEDDDQPLDFSSKTMHRNSDNNTRESELEPMQVSRGCGRGGGSSPPTASGHTLSQLFAQQMMRPSVITCGSSLMKAQQTPPHPSAAPPPPPPPSYAESMSTARHQTTYGAAADDEENCVQRRHNSGDNVRQREQQHSRRQVVTTSCEGVSDPVIEEHFRRSLGK